MFIGKIAQGERKLSASVCDAERRFTITPVMPKEESIAPMSVPTCLLLNKKQGSVDIVEILSLSILQARPSVVPGNVVLRDQRRLIGRCPKRFFASAFNAGRIFGNVHPLSSDGLVGESFVLGNVRLILRNLISHLHQIFMLLGSGFRFARKSLNEMDILVRIAGLMASDFMSTIVNLSEMGVLKLKTTLSRFVLIATDWSTWKNNESYSRDNVGHLLFGWPFVFVI